MANRPAKTFKAYPVEVAIFQGQYGYSCSVQKTFKKDNKYEHTNFLGPNDAAVAGVLLNYAFQWMLENGDKQSASVEKTFPDGNVPDDKDAAFKKHFENGPQGDESEVPF
jgi:hypothetical protein